MEGFLKIVFLVCVIRAATSKPMTMEEGQAMFLNILSNCKEQVGASENDVIETIKHGVPTTKAGGCLNTCVMVATGIMKDGKFSVEGSIQISQMTGDAEKAKNIALLTECEAVTSEDSCDLSIKIMECLHKVCARHGIDPSKDLL